MDPSRLFPRRRIAAAALLAACLGCAHVPQQSEDAKNARIEASTAELRLRVVELDREAMRVVDHLMLRVAELAFALLVMGLLGLQLLRPRA